MEESVVLMYYLLVILVFIIILTVLFSLLHRKSLRKLLEAELERTKAEVQHQKNMVKTIVSVQEAERKRIARIVHDDIGNRVNILSVWLNHPEAWSKDRSREIVMKQLPSLAEAVRNISHTLYPVAIEYIGLVAALEELAINVSVILKTDIIIQHTYTSPGLDVEVQVYRVIQEFLNNVLKHAGASRMQIHIRSTERSLAFLLEDNGRGFDPATIRNGMGLQNIESRIRLMQAAFKWKSAPGKGCRLIIIIPAYETAG